jgi:hypothetical protein
MPADIRTFDFNLLKALDALLTNAASRAPPADCH